MQNARARNRIEVREIGCLWVCVRVCEREREMTAYKAKTEGLISDKVCQGLGQERSPRNDTRNLHQGCIRFECNNLENLYYHCSVQVGMQ